MTANEHEERAPMIGDTTTTHGVYLLALGNQFYLRIAPTRRCTGLIIHKIMHEDYTTSDVE
jgi:hypothetical protein